MQISSTFETHLTSQAYGGKKNISGVEKVPLKLNTDDGGNFLEVFRMQAGQVAGLATPFSVAQVSFSLMMPRVVKAFHIHKKQEDLWFVPPMHRLLVNLHDLREDSPTFDMHDTLVLGGGSAQILRIPNGVAHGAKNCYNEPMFLFYATTEQFNAEAPDEFRLPWDHFGADVWELHKG
jgi:dTDP-4-dehydrorhamnose 3,5-epimerase